MCSPSTGTKTAERIPIPSQPVPSSSPAVGDEGSRADAKEKSADVVSAHEVSEN